MAERLGVTRSAISAWEIGRNEPPLAMIIEMKKILKTQDDQIFLPCEDTIGSEDEDGN
jgi:transcriptional regulator with XRE-family HTH domain